MRLWLGIGLLPLLVACGAEERAADPPTEEGPAPPTALTLGEAASVEVSAVPEGTEPRSRAARFMRATTSQSAHPR